MVKLPLPGIEKGQALFQGFEGRRLKPYLDTRGIWTVGDGITTLPDGTPVGPNTAPLSVSDCDELTRCTLFGKFVPGIQSAINTVLTVDETAALISLTWNIGVGGLERSSIRLCINAGEMHEAGSDFLLYCNSGGVFMPQLRRRRMAELAVWQADDPDIAMAMVAAVHASVAAQTADDLNAAELAAISGRNMMFATIKSWMKQVTSVLGASGLLTTLIAVFTGGLTLHQAIAPIVGSLVMIALKDNTNAKEIGAALGADVVQLTDAYIAGRAQGAAGSLGASAKLFALFAVPSFAALIGLSACSSTQVNNALQSSAGQLFCAINQDGGSQIVVGVIDAEASAALGAAAPVAVLATGMAASDVQADCAKAAAAVGAKSAIPVSPPAAAVSNVAINVSKPS